jgi:hypothetical protein
MRSWEAEALLREIGKILLEGRFHGHQDHATDHVLALLVEEGIIEDPEADT